MIKKIIALMMILSVSLFAINLQTASKAELMSIKGIGEVKADAIIKYRKSNKLKSASDLKGVDGIGEGIIKNVKNNVKVKEPSAKATKSKSKAKATKLKSKAKATTKKVEKKKTDTKKEVKKATDKKDSKRSKKLKESKEKAKKATNKKESKKSKAKKEKKKLKKKN